MPAEAKVCGECGALLTGDAPEGLCPKCLLHRAMESTPTIAAPASDHNHAARPATPPDSALRIPPSALGTVRYFGDYELLEEIARGGMGVVYKARQVSLNRLVAVKMILAGRFAGKADVERFYSEARAAANLQHPNIVAIHEIGEHDGLHYFSMDYIAGRNLAQVCGGQPLSAVKAALYVKKVALAVEFAHEQGVLHRDLKPQNVLIDRNDEPKVTDFGLAKQMGEESGLTQSGAVMGSPSYMAPEQAAGRTAEVTRRSDVYALGAILYELLTGRPPFKGNTVAETIMAVLQQIPERPSCQNAKMHEDLETICLKCLEKRPEDRYATARELAEDLQRFLDHEPIRAKPASAWRTASAWTLKHPWLITAALALMGAVAVLGAASLVYGLREYSQLVTWRSRHPGETSPYRDAWDFMHANQDANQNYVRPGVLMMFFLFVVYFFLLNQLSKGKPISTAWFVFFAGGALGMMGLGTAGIFLTVKAVVWSSWDSVTYAETSPTYGLVLVWLGVQMLLQLFAERQIHWFGRELVNPSLFGVRKAPPPAAPSGGSFAARWLPELVAAREEIKRGEFLKRNGLRLGIVLGCGVLALAASREWEWASIMFCSSLASALGTCCLALGLVPASRWRQVIEGLGLGRRFGSRGECLVSGGILLIAGMLSLMGHFVPAASGALGGMSLGTLAMILTLRRAREKGENSPNVDLAH